MNNWVEAILSQLSWNVVSTVPKCILRILCLPSSGVGLLSLTYVEIRVLPYFPDRFQGFQDFKYLFIAKPVEGQGLVWSPEALTAEELSLALENCFQSVPNSFPDLEPRTAYVRGWGLDYHAQQDETKALL